MSLCGLWLIRIIVPSSYAIIDSYHKVQILHYCILFYHSRFGYIGVVRIKDQDPWLNSVALNPIPGRIFKNFFPVVNLFISPMNHRKIPRAGDSI